MRSEDALQAAVCAYLERALPLASWWAAIPNGAVLAGDGKARAMQMAKLKRTGLRPGAPDLIVLHDGRLLAIELKAPGGSVSAAQAAACDAIVLAGGAYVVARSVEDVERYLAAHDVPLRARMLEFG